MNIATIGSGMIVDLFIESAKLVENVEIRAVYSRSEEKAIAFAKKHDIKKYYTDLDTMLANDEIDTIYVASPNSLHYEQSLKSLQAKKNVICEKPFTSNVKELDVLIKEAKKQNVFLWEAITNIYTPNLNIVKENLNKLGKVRMLTCNFSQFSSKYPAYLRGENPNVFNPDFSGGAMMDINLYNVHLVMYLFGKPIKYTYYPNIAENGIDTSGTLIFEYPDFIATLIGAKDSASYCYACIQGDEGTIIIDGASTGICKNVTYTKIKEESVSIGIKQKPHMYYEIEAFEKMLSIKEYDKCYETLNYSRDVLEVIETARKNAGIYFKADK